jgi:hypothetical protein
MRHLQKSMILFVVALLALGLAVTLAPTAASAQGEAPARPPVPRPDSPPPPPPPPPPPVAVEDNSYRAPTPVPLGRITGTVIDLRTGAPIVGASVAIGSHLVTSDANGNYDIWVEAGLYPVALQLTEGQGAPANGAQDAMVWGNDVVTLHLFFTSVAPLTTTPLSVPTEPVLALPPPSEVEVPVSLPVTAGEDRVAAALLLAGVALLMLGTVLAMLPRHLLAQAHVADQRLLGALLRRTPRPDTDEILNDLLHRNP